MHGLVGHGDASARFLPTRAQAPEITILEPGPGAYAFRLGSPIRSLGCVHHATLAPTSAMTETATQASTSCCPPSIPNVAPVIAVFVMRWTARAPTSVGRTTRWIGRVVRSCSRARVQLLAEDRRCQRRVDEPSRDQVHADGRELERQVLREGGQRCRDRPQERSTCDGGSAAGAANEEQGPSRANLAHGIPGHVQRQPQTRVDVTAALFEVELRERRGSRDRDP